MHYQVLVIGGGLSGLTAASLLAKRGLRVGVVDKSYNPGGSCGVFKRQQDSYDQGSTMMFGFGEKGFNAHRFVFNCLEQPIDIVKNPLMYRMHYQGHIIRFYDDIPTFIDELSRVFPTQKAQLTRFYQSMQTLYQHVMVDHPTYTTPDEVKPWEGLKGLIKHPISYLRFLGYLNQSAKHLLAKYFDDPAIFSFFDKITSTYCYATVEEAPAILAAVMFVDNHMGGSYYPVGSTLMVPGLLEKVIEEHQGDMLLNQEVIQILFNQEDEPCGVVLADQTKLTADYLIYSGTVWNLYGKLIPQGHLSANEITWAKKQVPTYPSVVLYTKVKKAAIDADCSGVEMLIGNPNELDESEVTIYITSLKDKSVTDDNHHLVMAIGPSFQTWNAHDKQAYQKQKQNETERLLKVLEKRFPDFRNHLVYTELATPLTIERYTLKNNGAVAGPKQMLGQHMFKRLKTRTKWRTLFCCGESTVLGTGTPTVTTSGLAAANAVLRELQLKPFVYDAHQTNYVTIHHQPKTSEEFYQLFSETLRPYVKLARDCRYCEYPPCAKPSEADIRGMMRRLSVGNVIGASKIAEQIMNRNINLAQAEQHCIRNRDQLTPVAITKIVAFLMEGKSHD